jgi:predicted transcriptional regulator
MASVGVRELPVVDEDQHVIGVIDEARIAHEYVRVRAAAAVSGVRAIDPSAVI